MFHPGERETLWNSLSQPWDLIIVGGGITGAGVLKLAAQAGLKVLLVEAGDFASGTSSRSSKLIHGGFRYLRNGQISVTRESVREREWLLKETPGLVTPLSHLLPYYERYGFPSWQLGLGVTIYDLLAPKWDHHTYSTARLNKECPELGTEGLKGGYQYYDAQMDDSKMVMRLIREAAEIGGTAISYARAEKVLRRADGTVCGIALRDVSGAADRTLELQAKVVVNAAGPWSDELRSQVSAPARIRKLRGSHLIFDAKRFPLCSAVTLFHPRDRRALFMLPWEGVSMVGTTDLDHPAEYEQNFSEPFATPQEIEYLLEAANSLFPGAKLEPGNVLSTFAGLRPTIKSDDANPSKVSRAHALWVEEGMVTITGGKYTTFRIMARHTLSAVLKLMGREPSVPQGRVFEPVPEARGSAKISAETALYLTGRYSTQVGAMLDACADDDLEHIGALPNIWGELRWSARTEAVEHLDDLLLRRVRLGMLLPGGAQSELPRIRAIVQPELGWDDARWQREEAAFLATWRTYYSPKPGK